MEKDLISEYKKLIKYISSLDMYNYGIKENITDLQELRKNINIYIEKLIKNCLMEKCDFDKEIKEIKEKVEKLTWWRY